MHYNACIAYICGYSKNVHPSQQVKEYVRREYIEPARKRGDARVRIVAGDIHRALRMTNRVPTVCQALNSRQFLKENHLVLESREGPPSGLSTTVVFTYLLQDINGEGTPLRSQAPFLLLRGIAKEVFTSLGGGESFIRREREKFYEPEKGAS